MIVALLAPLTQPAAACGGLFCNNQLPVVQNAERVVFGLDPQNDEVEVHVQVLYEGPSEEFAWVVPVSAQPEVFVSSRALFDQVAQSTSPIFALQREQDGNCRDALGDMMFAFGGMESALTAGFDLPPEGGVQVLDSKPVGPYDTLVLRANSASVLTDYLTEQGYDLPDGVGEALAPYVAENAHFVALRLQKDRDVGDIVPLGMRYAGTAASIPIQLTAVAASEDLVLEAYVLGAHRAVPTSYLHVQLNEAAIDWYAGGANYWDLVGEAVDEAGGRAFVTNYAGPSEGMGLPGIDVPVAALRGVADLAGWLTMVTQSGVPADEQLAAVVAPYVMLPEGADPVRFVQCPSCVEGWVAVGFDPAAATDALVLQVLEPYERARALFEAHPMVTRMSTTLSPSEMTVDPMFVLNPDLPEVPALKTASEVVVCGANKRWDRSPRRLELADGRALGFPSVDDMRGQDGSPIDYLAEHGFPRAQIVEQLGATGSGEVLVDETDRLVAMAGAHNARLPGVLGCSTMGTRAGAGAGGAAALLGFIGLLGLRRRR